MRPIQLPSMGGRRARLALTCDHCHRRGHDARHCGVRALAQPERRAELLRDRAAKLGLGGAPKSTRPVDSARVSGNRPT